METKKKHKLITIMVVLSIIASILGIIGFGIYIYLNYSNINFLKAENNGITAEAFLYDKNGNLLSSGTQMTTVNGVAGIYYMSLKIKTTNIGNVPLTDLRITEAHPIELSNGLQGANAIQPTLPVSASNILQYDSANSCTTDAQCGTSEKCQSTANGLKCLIDISNLLGTINFGATLEAKYKDAQGIDQIISTLINLPFLFEQEEVIFRTSATNGIFNSAGVQVVVDRESDGTLEVYTYQSTALQSYSPANFIAWTVQNNLIYKCGTATQICITQDTTLDKDLSYSSVSRNLYNLGGTLPITKLPTEPYASQNCAGTRPCQERYSVSVSPPVATCGNNVKEGSEVCDGTDLAGATCQSQGFTGGTLTCSASCTSYEVSQCINGGGGTSIKFRTFDLTYGSGNAVAYGTACDGSTNLIRYGKTSGACTEFYCDYTSQNLNVPSASGTTKFWFRNADEVCICNDGVTSHTYALRYTTADTDATKVSNVPTLVDSNKELLCSA